MKLKARRMDASSSASRNGLPPQVSGRDERKSCLPVEPPMRVVTKGWWVMREEEVPREELERQDRLRKK